MTWGSTEEHERRNRIRLAVAAYAYEVKNNPILTDDEFDALAAAIDPAVTTGHPVYDEFFLTKFVPYTGLWVHDYPEPRKLDALYQRHMRRTA